MPRNTQLTITIQRASNLPHRPKGGAAAALASSASRRNVPLSQSGRYGNARAAEGPAAAPEADGYSNEEVLNCFAEVS